jgi:protein-disulfide isomerase
MSKQFWAVIAGIVIVLVGIFVLTGNKSDTNGSSSKNTTAATSHIEGKGSTGVTLVEFGDYQCPYCSIYYPTVKQIVAEYNDKITFQFVNFPLPNLHQNAFSAARAAEAADKQGKFWEMHDIIYTNSDPNGAKGWVASNAPSSIFNQYAQQLGLNIDQFKKDYASSAVNDAINADMTKGNKLGIEGTPAFMVNGKKVTIQNTAEDFKKVLDEAIAAKKTAQ